MAQTPTVFWNQGDLIDYTPVSAVTAGDVVVLGSIPLVAPVDIAAGVQGSLRTRGVHKVPKDTSTFTAGDSGYWNTTGSPVSGTASSGALTSTAGSNKLMGILIADAATGDAFAYVLLTAAQRTATIAGSVTADDITGSDSSLGIFGLAAAQGGTIALVGGTSSTSGNAGGPVTITGGTPGATGIGGAITITGAAGGATSGAGGAVNFVGGAGTAGNAAGGAAGQTGGAGQGSAAGGAASMIGGAGGATGAGGAITITSGAGGGTSGAAGAIAISVGSATSANGANLTLTAGNGAGGTNAGGNVNLVGGTAVSTGVPGEVQVNADSGLIQISEALTATDATRTVFVATRACRLKGVKAVFSTASTSGTLQLEKCTGTTAPGSGTSLLTGTMSLAGTANTVVSGTLVATVASITLAAGDRISIVIAGTMTNLAGGRVTLSVAPA